MSNFEAPRAATETIEQLENRLLTLRGLLSNYENDYSVAEPDISQGLETIKVLETEIREIEVKLGLRVASEQSESRGSSRNEDNV